MFVITGATGNIGSKIVESLLAKKQKVRAVGRDPKKLEALKAKGAEVFSGNLEDPADVQKAFRDAQACFTMIPPHYGARDFRGYQNRVSENFEQALRSSGIRTAVNLSSVGAHLPGGTGPILGLADNEMRLNQVPDVNLLHLRPGFFMENFFFNLTLIKEQGVNGTPLKADLPIPMIATRDIAAVAAQRLQETGFKSRTQELLGPRDLTMVEATQALGRTVGKPDLKYVPFPYEDAEKAMTALGMSLDVAQRMVEMYRAFNERRIVPEEKRGAGNTTPTSIEEFAEKIFAAVYRQS